METELIAALALMVAGLIGLVWVVARREPMRGEVEVDITGWFQRRWHRRQK